METVVNKNKKFGFWFLFMMTITATLGSSLLISFNFVTFLSKSSPWLMILAWVLGGLFILPETLLMLEPSVSYKVNGTAYGWLKRAKWNNVAFWFGWILVSMVAAAAVAGACIAVGNVIIGLLKIDNAWAGKGIGIGILLVLAFLQLFFKNSNNILQIIFTILTIAPVILVLILAFVYGTFNRAVENPTIFQGLGQAYISSFLLIPAISYTSFAYSGVEVSTYVVADAEKPKRNIPLTIVFSTIAIVIIYLVYGVALISLSTSADLSDLSKPVPFNLKIPDWAKIFFNVLAIFLFVGSLNSYLVYQTRLIYKLSEEKDLFKFFLKTSKKTNKPWASMFLLIALGITYILTNNLFNIVGYFAFATSSLKIIMVSCIWYLRKKDLEYKRIYNNFTFYFLLLFSYISCILTLVGAILAMFLFGQQNQIWIPITILAIVLSLYPFSYLKNYLQNKKQVNSN